MQIKVTTHKTSGGIVKSHKRKVKGKGVIVVKSARRKSARVPAHLQSMRGHALKKRNSVGNIVYKGNKPKQ